MGPKAKGRGRGRPKAVELAWGAEAPAEPRYQPKKEPADPQSYPDNSGRKYFDGGDPFAELEETNKSTKIEGTSGKGRGRGRG